MSDRLYRRADDLEAFAPSPAHLPAPGKTTLTSRIMRSARDDNGVALDADAHLDRAASSTGTALPGDLRERFEGSLGADLSSVRVHTGADSASAASAVGARAYTVGQDVHFGAGQYDPSSAFGVHLIAHEVAHTVQQAGSTPTRQNKLEVSTPGDSAELEADRAADAMVSGAAATVASASAGIQRDDDCPGRYAGRNDCPADENGVPYYDPSAAGAGGAAGKGRDAAPRQPGQSTRDEDELEHGSSQMEQHPNPDDPYSKPPTDFSGFRGGGPVNTDAPFQPTFGFAPPVGDIGLDGQVLIPNEEQINRASAAQNAFREALECVASSTANAYPREKDYREASNKIDANGELATLLGWTNPGGAGDLGSLALQQKNFNSGVKVGDVFAKGADGTPGTAADVDLSKTHESQEAVDARQTLNRSIADVQTANARYRGAVAVCANAGDDVGLAFERLAIEKLGEEVANAETELASANKEKTEIVESIQQGAEGIKTAIELMESVGAAAEGNEAEAAAGVAKIVVTIGAAVKTTAATEEINHKIEGLSSRISSGRAALGSRKVKLAESELDSAISKFNNAKRAVDTEKGAVTVAVGKVQQAYNDLGKAAGQAAGGSAENQARVEAAIRAIPKVEKVVADLGLLTSSCVAPGYSEEAGRGFNASNDAGQFQAHAGMVGWMWDHYAGEVQTWTERLISLQGIANTFGHGERSVAQ